MKTNTLPAATNAQNRNYLRGGGLRFLTSIILITLFGLSTKAQTYLTPGDEFVILCDKDEIMIRLINTDPGMNADLISTDGIASPGYSYDPGTGELYITGATLTGPKSYGTYEFLLSGADYYFTIYIIECCERIDFDLIIVNDRTTIVGNSFTGLNILILDELIADNVPVEFTSCMVYMGAESRITLDGDIDFFSTGSTFTSYCEYRWAGIFEEGENARITFENSTLQMSSFGLYSLLDAKIEAINSVFDDNLLGIVAYRHTLTGPYYGNSNLLIEENNFSTFISYVSTIGQMKFAPGSQIEVELDNLMSSIWYLTFVSTNFAHVLAIESDHVQVGGYNMSSNFFEGHDGWGVLAYESKVKVENNIFDDISIAVQAELSEIVVGGATTSYGNTFISTYNIFIESKQNIYKNTYTSSVVNVASPDIYFTGTNAGTHIADNLFSNNSYCSITQPTQSVKKVIVENNFFNNSYLSGLKVLTSTLTDGFVIINNQFGTNIAHYDTLDQTNEGYYQLRLEECHGARVGSNQFNLLPTMGSPDSYLNGIYLKLCRVAQIKDNYFEQRTVGIFGTDDLTGGTGTLFSCNYFEDFIYGFYFDDATVSTQGGSAAGVDNVWVEQTASIARIYVDMTTYDYYHTSGAPKDPFAGVGVVGVGGSVNPNPLGMPTFAIADCGILNKTNPSISTKQEEFNIFPNPSTGNIAVIIPSQLFESASLMIYDVTGKLILERKLSSTFSEIQVEANPGIYTSVIYINKVPQARFRLIIL